jgi:acyl-CoA hydrolase
MIVGIPRESWTEERRVALTPAGVHSLSAAGQKVIVESDAGVGCGFSTDAYRETGASIVYSSEELFARADFVPIFLSEIESLFSSGAMPVDVALIHVSSPDEHGFCSFGAGVDTTKTAAECARIVIAQVNPKVPRTLGDSFIHLNKIHYVVEVNDDLLEYPMGEVSETAMRMGRSIADLIEDGSTL